MSNPNVFSGTVLIAEDEPGQLELLRLVLRSKYKDVKIITAITGLEAYTQASLVVPDIVIADIYLPEMSGINLCKLLKETAKTSHVSVIIVTSQGNESARIASFKAGADDFLEKPINAVDLISSIEKTLLNNRPLVTRKTEVTHQKILLADTIQNKVTNIFDNSTKLLQSDIRWQLSSEELELMEQIREDCRKISELLS